MRWRNHLKIVFFLKVSCTPSNALSKLLSKFKSIRKLTKLVLDEGNCNESLFLFKYEKYMLYRLNPVPKIEKENILTEADLSIYCIRTLSRIQCLESMDPSARNVIGIQFQTAIYWIP